MHNFSTLIIIFLSSLSAFAETGKPFTSVNSYSPLQCHIKVIEIGYETAQAPDIHLALFYDQLASKFRRIYDYNYPTHFSQGKIVDTSERRQMVMSKILWDFAGFLSSSVPISAAAYFVTDEVIESYIRRNQFHRYHAAKLLEQLVEDESADVWETMDRTQIKKIIAQARLYSYGGIFVDDLYDQSVYEYMQDTRRLYRTQNYSRVLNRANIEGLTVKPLSKDFLIVYYDSTKSYPRDLNEMYLELANLRENTTDRKSTLVPLGLYAIGQDSQRLLTVDYQNEGRMQRRKAVKYFADLGTQAGVTFLPFPLNVAVFLTDKGVRYTLQKKGNTILSDLISSEAELKAVLESGIAEIPPELVEQTRKELANQQDNFFLNQNKNWQKARELNKVKMDNYLRSSTKELCQEFENLQENEFNHDYLSRNERISRNIRKPFTLKKYLNREKEQIISERKSRVNALKVLKIYDPIKKNVTDRDLIQALLAIGMAKNDADISWLAAHINNPANEEIEFAALHAARMHQSSQLLPTLTKYLKSYKSVDEELFVNGSPFFEALQAIANIRYEKRSEAQLAISELKDLAQIHRLTTEKSELQNIIRRLESIHDNYLEPI